MFLQINRLFLLLFLIGAQLTASIAQACTHTTSGEWSYTHAWPYGCCAMSVGATDPRCPTSAVPSEECDFSTLTFIGCPGPSSAGKTVEIILPTSQATPAGCSLYGGSDSFPSNPLGCPALKRLCCLAPAPTPTPTSTSTPPPACPSPTPDNATCSGVYSTDKIIFDDGVVIGVSPDAVNCTKANPLELTFLERAAAGITPNCAASMHLCCMPASPTPTPTPVGPPATPTPAVTPGGTPTPTPTPVGTPGGTPTPTPAGSPSITPTPTPLPTSAPGPYGVATFDANYHACGRGNGSTIPQSPVSDLIGGTRTNGQQFDNVVNKRLACCVNSSNGKIPNYLATTGNQAPPSSTTAPFPEKYDCVDNSNNANSFNNLWSNPVGGAGNNRSNAIVLMNSQGQPITGFYSLNGERCGFGEMAAIQRARVNPHNSTSGQMATVGGGATYECRNIPGDIIPAPAAGSPVTAAPPVCVEGVANGGANLYRCPFVVRAAFQATCPKNFIQSGTRDIRRTFRDNTNTSHCGVASAVKIHIRIEQAFPIAGRPEFKAVDSFVDASKAMNIDVKKIITSGK